MTEGGFLTLFMVTVTLDGESGPLRVIVALVLVIEQDDVEIVLLQVAPACNVIYDGTWTLITLPDMRLFSIVKVTVRVDMKLID